MVPPIVFWDIDGTILLNDLPSPDWDNPAAVHPVTGENVCGPMPQYWAHNHLNPELTSADISRIKHIVTARPDYRQRMTRRELLVQGIRPRQMVMFPGSRRYTHTENLYYKAYALCETNADYYVDEDPVYRQELQKHLTAFGACCECLSIAEWREMI